MKKTQVGTVVSDKMQESAVVKVTLWKTHRILRKRFKRYRKFMAHNPENSYKIGDIVEITEVKPISKRKNWLITKKIESK
ncbi:30S ribosomal protein S17 [Candidatus Berkelbacteria bacterium]|nr:30S ribosomal protein S17 [Candidatus Berkelbacteria bacterium]